MQLTQNKYLLQMESLKLQTDSDVDLGTTGVRFKDAFVDTLTTTGDISVGDDLTVEGGVIDLKNTGSQSELRLYCESSNAHKHAQTSCS